MLIGRRVSKSVKICTSSKNRPDAATVLSAETTRFGDEAKSCPGGIQSVLPLVLVSNLREGGELSCIPSVAALMYITAKPAEHAIKHWECEDRSTLHTASSPKSLQNQAKVINMGHRR